MIAFLSAPYFKSAYSNSARHLTAFYALFIFAGLMNCFSARSERFSIFSGIFKNRLFLSIMIFISVIQMLIVYFGGSLFRSTPLTLGELLTVASLSATVLVFDSIRRLLAKLT